jgi:hypothetical protein
VDCEESKSSRGQAEHPGQHRHPELSLIINTPQSRKSEYDDSTSAKRPSQPHSYITTMTAAWASAKGIVAFAGKRLYSAQKEILQNTSPTSRRKTLKARQIARRATKHLQPEKFAPSLLHGAAKPEKRRLFGLCLLYRGWCEIFT